MDQNWDQSREVADARERVAQDVRSVAENANVVERAKETVQNRMDDAKSAVGGTVQGARDSIQSSVQNIGSSVRDNLRDTNLMENPVAMLVGGLAVGFLIGLVLPVTRFENERIGPIAEDMKDRVREARSEVVRRGGEVIKETIDASKTAATNSLRDQVSDLGGSGGTGTGNPGQRNDFGAGGL